MMCVILNSNMCNNSKWLNIITQNNIQNGINCKVVKNHYIYIYIYIKRSVCGKRSNDSTKVRT